MRRRRPRLRPALRARPSATRLVNNTIEHTGRFAARNQAETRDEQVLNLIVADRVRDRIAPELPEYAEPQVDVLVDLDFGLRRGWPR